MHFSKPGEGNGFWRCAVCREHRKYLDPGCFVRVANEVLAIVCDGACSSEVKRRIGELLPDAFPETDAKGFLV